MIPAIVNESDDPVYRTEAGNISASDVPSGPYVNPIRTIPNARKIEVEIQSPALNNTGKKNPNNNMAMVAKISVILRPCRSAQTAETGILTAKNKTATSCAIKKPDRWKCSAEVPQLSVKTVIR